MASSSEKTAVRPARDPALDGLRGLAILLVFLFHYGGGLRAQNPFLRACGYLTQAGWIGVDLFFALSGFLITGTLARVLHHGPQPAGAGNSGHRAQTLRTFYLRRALRILPLYTAALLTCATAALATGARAAQLKPLLLYAAFVQNLPPFVNASLRTPPPLPLFHLWSLAVEEQFYLLWPFALLAVRTPRRALHLALWVFAASCLFRGMVFAPHVFSFVTADSFATFLPTRAGALALGSALALDRPGSSADATGSTEDKRVPARLVLIATAAASVLGLFTVLHTHSLLLNSRAAFLFLLPAADIVSVVLLALALAPGSFRAALGSRPLAFLGRISYGVYVFHILLEPLFDRLGTAVTHTHAGFPYQTARLLIAFFLTLGVAWLSFTVLERPFLRLKRNFSYRRQSPPAQKSLLPT